MNRRIKKKYDKRGQLVEVLQTSVFGLVFESKTTFEYDTKGHVSLEAEWYDTKTIKTTRRYTSINGKQSLVEKTFFSHDGEILSLQHYSSAGELVSV